MNKVHRFNLRHVPVTNWAYMLGEDEGTYVRVDALKERLYEQARALPGDDAYARRVAERALRELLK